MYMYVYVCIYVCIYTAPGLGNASYFFVGVLGTGLLPGRTERSEGRQERITEGGNKGRKE
jgi:hypothetical protein